MKKSKVIITIEDHGNGKLEFRCRCQNGHSKPLNDLALHIADELPKAVHSAAIGFYRKKGAKNAIH